MMIMQYDPIKRSLGNVFNRTPCSQKTILQVAGSAPASFLAHSKGIEKAETEVVSTLNRLPMPVPDSDNMYITSPINFPHATITGLDIKQEQVDDCNCLFLCPSDGRTRCLSNMLI